jgi:selenocysteine-specific elongation factor
LVRALTGQDPDRLSEEHRRGLSIELGYCWTELPPVGEVAFVDVPGHERFVSTMLAGVGPVPAALLVVAADDPWMPQTAEHLAALDAFGVTHAVVAISRSDLADPGPSTALAVRHVEGTTLAGSPIVAVSARTGAGLDDLRQGLVAMLERLPEPESGGPVRLWVDRCFSIVGAGTVVTGTLPEGVIHVGMELTTPEGSSVRVRGIETLGRPAEKVRGVARVALRLGGGAPESLRRGTALFEPGGWQVTDRLDVRLRRAEEPPERPMVHIGAASVGARCRILGGNVARIAVARPLPLHVGDRFVLRDPGSRRLWGAVVLDPVPPPLNRRGAARARSTALAPSTGRPDLADELRRRTVVRISELRRIGVDVDETSRGGLAMRSGDWLLDVEAVTDLRSKLAEVVATHREQHPLDAGVPSAAAARALRLPTADLLAVVVSEPLSLVDGRVVDGGAQLPVPLLQAVRRVAAELGENPFAAPEAGRLVELGLDGKALAAAARAGLLLRLGEQVVLMPGADEDAAALLRDLPQPFTTSEARVRLGTSRRVVLPLLEHLDSRRLTRRLPDDRREVVESDRGG